MMNGWAALIGVGPEIIIEKKKIVAVVIVLVGYLL